VPVTEKELSPRQNLSISWITWLASQTRRETIALVAGSADATLIYNNQPTPRPKNLVALGFAATSTSEFGGQLEFAGTNRTSPAVTVTMSSWACQNLQGGAACATTPHASFSWPITLNICEVGPENSVGALIATTTENVNVPYYAPTHEADVGEDSLDVAFAGSSSVGTDPLPEDAYVNSSWSAMYGSTGTVGTFSIAGEWAEYQPVFKIKAKSH
jgi:hypothetical protein